MIHYLLEARLLKIDWKVGEALPERLAKCEIAVPKEARNNAGIVLLDASKRNQDGSERLKWVASSGYSQRNLQTL